MSESKKSTMLVNKFTLTGGKVIYLREPTVGDLETIARLAGKQAGNENQAHLSVLMQKETLVQMLVQIDNDRIEGPININNTFTLREFKQAIKAVSMVTGDDDEGNELEVSLVSL